ncbi:MAG: glycosyltransferase family A protein [Campylobacterota bacterium]
MIITAYNDVATLAEAIESVLDQELKADEVIVVDDGSSDASSEVAKVYDEVSLLRQKHMGRFSARNNGVMMAANKWIAFLDAAQKWDRDKLKKQAAFHKNSVDEKVSVCTSGECISLKEALVKGRVESSSVMIEKRLFDQLGGFDEAFEVSEDDELWLRAVDAVK